MEVSKLSDIEFKLMVIKMLKELTDDNKELSENYNSMKNKIETIHKNQEEMNNKISEIKNTLEGITSRLDDAEDRINELQDKVAKNTQIEQEKEERLRRNEQAVKELQDNMKRNMTENFPNLMRKKVTQIQETQRVPIKRNPKRPTSRHIIVKMAKFQDKERILRAAREKQEVMYKGAPIRLAADFSMETLSQKRMARNIPSNETQRPAT